MIVVYLADIFKIMLDMAYSLVKIGCFLDIHDQSVLKGLFFYCISVRVCVSQERLDYSSSSKKDLFTTCKNKSTGSTLSLKFCLRNDRKQSPSISCYIFLSNAAIFPVITSILEKEEGKAIKVVPVDLPFISQFRSESHEHFGSKRFKKNVGSFKKISSLSFGDRVKSHFLLSEPNYSICHTFFWNVTIFLSSQTYGWLFLFYIYWFLCIKIHVNAL